ncbi:hypothetical protein YC2023_076942 [Brassica napus]
MITKLLRRYNLDMNSLTQTVSLLSNTQPWQPHCKSTTGTGNPPSAMDVKRPLDVASLEGFLHEAMIGWKAVGTNPLPSSEEEVGPLSPVAISIAAGFSGAIAAAASHSFDTARTRAQCVILPKYMTKERKFLKWNKQGKRLERWTGIHHTDRGIGTRMARICVASTVMVGCYYLAVDLLVPK